MAIKFENTSGPQAKPAEKRAEAAHAPAGEKDKKRLEGPVEEADDDKGTAKAKKPRGSFKKK
jgi:hypothetical protein